MSERAWKLTQDQKVLAGRAIVSAIENDQPLPTSPAEGKQWLLDRGFEFVSKVVGVQFYQSEKDGIMYIAVPPRAAIKAAVDNFNQTGQYDIPITYRQIATNTSTLSELEQFHFRIGDYTIAHCT